MLLSLDSVNPRANTMNQTRLSPLTCFIVLLSSLFVALSPALAQSGVEIQAANGLTLASGAVGDAVSLAVVDAAGASIAQGTVTLTNAITGEIITAAVVDGAAVIEGGLAAGTWSASVAAPGVATASIATATVGTVAGAGAIGGTIATTAAVAGTAGTTAAVASTQSNDDSSGSDGGSEDMIGDDDGGVMSPIS